MLPRKVTIIHKLLLEFMFVCGFSLLSWFLVLVVKEKIHANDYALSFESAANSSNVSNDGDHAAADGVEFNLRDNISSSQLSEAGEPFSIAINTPFTADIDEQPVSVPSTPVTKSAKQVETAEAPETITSTATPAAPAPAAAAATLLGSIVNTIGSAKKLASTPAPVPPSAPTSAVDADKAGKDNKDKEILLLKKTLKKKNAVRFTCLLACVYCVLLLWVFL